MYISVTEEEKIILNQLKQDLYTLNLSIIKLMMSLGTFLLNGFIAYFKSYDDFSLENIRRKGIKQILTERALAFFGITLEEKKIKKSQTSRTKVKRGGKLVKKCVRVVLFPCYWIILWTYNSRKKYGQQCKPPKNELKT